MPLTYGVDNTQVFSGAIGGPWSFGDSLLFNFSTPFLLGSAVVVDAGYGLVTEFIGAPTPEPSSTVLLVSAMLLVAYSIRRKARAVRS